jgi:putative phosphoribosyl transferase
MGAAAAGIAPRNRYVAGVLQIAGFATRLMDLLTAEEDALDEPTRALRFDIDLLARRLIGATRWLLDQIGCGAGKELVRHLPDEGW